MPVESDWQLFNVTKPGTLAAAATIAPTSFFTVLTGDAAAVATITPPFPQVHMLALQFGGVKGVASGGNVLTTKASVVGEIMLLVWNPNSQKYVPVG